MSPTLHDIPTAEPNSTLRCHWATDTNPETGESVLVFVPGCERMLFDPEHEQCHCDNLQHRLAIQLEQRRDCDEEITAQRRRLRVWARAGAAAYTVLTGRKASFVHPEELANAARDAAR